jgi:hypothetical protein
MNINEHMNQLGQIGSVGYSPTEAMIDDLLSRTKRARAVRQGTAAVVGSVSAVALGVVGAQIYVTIAHRNDAATQDRNLIENGLPGIFDFDSQYGPGYTGIDQASKDAFEKIYEDLNIAAQIEAKHLADKAAAEAAAAAAAGGTTTGSTSGSTTGTTTGTTTKPTDPPGDTGSFSNPWEGESTTCTNGTWTAPGGVATYSCTTATWTFAAGYFMFGNGEVYKCDNWTDAATGATFQGAISNKPVSGSFNGDWEKKRIFCNVGATYTDTVSDYMYMGGDLNAWSGNVCTGTTYNVWGALQRISCLTTDELWSQYGTWSGGMSGGNHPWTQNNGYRKILVDQASFKWFSPCARYYDIASPPSGWNWTGSAWAEVPPPA